MSESAIFIHNASKLLAWLRHRGEHAHLRSNGNMTEQAVKWASEARKAERKNIFLSALIEGPSGSGPVRVRNLSRRGAMLDGTLVPKVGEAVTLMRGRLRTCARVAWQSNGKFGLAFAREVNVEEWLAPTENANQSAVDEVVHSFRMGTLQGPSDDSHHSRIPATLAVATVTLTEVLRNVGDRFSSSPALLSGFPAELQAFDLAVQLLENLSAVASGPDIDTTTSGRLSDLIAACQQANKQIQHS